MQVPSAAFVAVTPAGTQVPGTICQDWIESLMKWTEPSAKAMFTPPGWKLDAEPKKIPTPPVQL